jgi:Tol biopolymer transport system component
MVEFAEPEFLLFVRDGALMAQRFDLATLQVAGEPVVVSDRVQGSGANGRVGVSASRTGVVVFRQGLGESGADAQLAWLDRTGRELGTVGVPANIRGFELSPDGRRVAVHADNGPGRGDIWVTDVERGTTSRLTFDPENHSMAPVWAADGRRILFAKRGTSTIYDRDANGVGEERLIYQGKGALSPYPTAVSSDGTLVLGQLVADARRWDIFALSQPGGAPAPIVSGLGLEAFGQVSPNGRWLAFQSNQSGRSEVFIQSFPAAGTKLQVSTTGGIRPRWRGDGRELYFLDSGGGAPVTAVAVEPDGDGLRLGAPKALFRFTPISALGHDIGFNSYAVSSDGQRFLVARQSFGQGVAASETPLTVVLNWDAALR